MFKDVKLQLLVIARFDQLPLEVFVEAADLFDQGEEDSAAVAQMLRRHIGFLRFTR